MKQSVTELPFNRFLGIEVAADPSQLLRLPAGGQYLNHLSTVHASAQLALAEASSDVCQEQAIHWPPAPSRLDAEEPERIEDAFFVSTQGVEGSALLYPGLSD